MTRTTSTGRSWQRSRGVSSGLRRRTGGSSRWSSRSFRTGVAVIALAATRGPSNLRRLPEAPCYPARSNPPGAQLRAPSGHDAPPPVQFKGKNWKKVAEGLEGRTDVQCLHRWQVGAPTHPPLPQNPPRPPPRPPVAPPGLSRLTYLSPTPVAQIPPSCSTPVNLPRQKPLPNPPPPPSVRSANTSSVTCTADVARRMGGRGVVKQLARGGYSPQI